MRQLIITVSILLSPCFAQAAEEANAEREHGIDPTTLFADPEALLDAEGHELLTGRAAGCPFAADFDGDGAIDLILGAKVGMDTARGDILLIRNVGDNDEPRFDIANARSALPDSAASKETINCGCKSGGYVMVQAFDFNDDGHLDIAYSDTYKRAYLLLNNGDSATEPTFTRQVFFDMEKKNHGMHAGGGDWNGDGVPDFLHMPFGGAQFKLFAGARQQNGGVRFEDGGLKSCTRIAVQRERDDNKPQRFAWAWDYSGTAVDRGVTEYIGIKGDSINFYELKDGQSRKLAELHRQEGGGLACTASDLDGDGVQDLLFSSGLWKQHRDQTKISWMRGIRPDSR